MFLGWYSEGSDERFQFGQEVAVNSDETIRIDGRFKGAVYVSFVNDGENPEKDKIIKVKELVPGEKTDGKRVPVVVMQTGYVFKHWSLTRNGPPFDFNQPINENTVLYSVLGQPWTVSFDSDGGFVIPPEYVDHGGRLGELEIPTRVGYTFNRWVDENGNTFNMSTPITSDRKLKAIWTPNRTTRYRVVYMQENKEGPNEDWNYYVKETVLRTGATGSIAVYTDKTGHAGYEGFELDAAKTKATEVTIDEAGNTIRRVYYKRKRYTLHFKSYYNPLGRDLHTVQNIKFGQNTSAAWSTIPPSYSSYTWYISRYGTISYSIPPDMPIGDLTVYGRQDGYYPYIIFFKERINGVNTNQDIRPQFNFSGSRGIYLTQEDYISVPGFTTFSNPNDGSQNSIPGHSSGANIFNIYYVRNKYSITFHTNDGTDGRTIADIPYESDISDKAPSEYVIGETKKKINGLEHTFTGWYEDIETVGNIYSFEGRTMPSENMILYAGWEPSTHTLTVYNTIDDNGEHVEFGNIEHNGHLEDIEPLLTADRPEGANVGDFLGWYWFQRDEHFVKFNFNTPALENLELYPVWRNINFHLSYDLNGGTPQDGLIDNNSYLAYTHAVVKETEGIDSPSDDEIFLGWTDKRNSKWYHANDLVYMDRKNIELEAQWGPKLDTADITYNPNGGNGEARKLTLPNNSTHRVQDDAFDSSNIYSRPGYELVGWNTSEDGTGQAFQKGEDIVVDNTGNNTLYAQWESTARVNIVLTKKWEIVTQSDKFDFTVQLYRDGEPDGEPVKINKSQSSHTWADRPREKKMGADFQDHVYTVKELNVPEGYRAYIGKPILSEDGETINIEVTNFKRSFLPGTGGKGTGLFHYVAVTFILIGIVIGIKKLNIRL